MTDAALVLQCMPADYDAATATCAAPFYAPPDTAFPTLSVADAQTIGLQIALLWGAAWGIRMCKRALNEIG